MTDIPKQEETTSSKLLGKFETVGDLETAYKQLERKLHSQPKETLKAPVAEAQKPPAEEPKAEPQQEQEEEQKETPPQPPPNPSDEAQVQQFLGSRGLDLAELQAEFAAHGDLKAETYARLEAAGISREMVESYKAGQAAIASTLEREVYERTGGREGWERLAHWASHALSPAEQAEFDALLAGPNQMARLIAIEALNHRFEQEYGRESEVIGGSSGPSESYGSQADLLKDIQDPRYEQDESFRQEVMAKAGRAFKSGRI